ncbi:uncharacterized protein LOC117105734 [Anneissia japonica]|uniref:uncharacterized protein LOC117105734 n=1 Tax=Anneissia japonica TaxID=1529436 RepID=UPI00142556B5|nr:uncharacterized protein LOC117105734 [Anneissia japonica]
MALLQLKYFGILRLQIVFTICCLWPVVCKSEILISEINADNPTYDIREFIEFVNNGTQAVNLSSYTVVLYNGNNNQAYFVRRLSGMLQPGDYYLLGSGNVRPVPDIIISQRIIQNGLDAVALYKSPTVNLIRGLLVTNESLVDAVVYDNGGFTGSHTLLDVLTPGQTAAYENAFASPVNDESISRCDWSGVRNSSYFAVMPLSPGASNPCNATTLQSVPSTPSPNVTVSPIRISEINADNPGSDFMEFIELYNNGNSEVNLDNYTVALFNGRNNRVYRLFYLTGYSVAANGYFLIGSYRINPSPDYIVPNASNANFLQSGPDAVAVYYGDRNLISTGMRTSRNLDLLVDAVVYDRRAGRLLSLTTVLTPGEGTVHEDRNYFSGDDESISRCRGMDARKAFPFRLTPATPGAPNNCTLPEPTPTPTPTSPNSTCEEISQNRVFINELHIGTDGPQYIELILPAKQNMDNYILAIFRGNSGSLYRTIHLSGYTPSDIFFVIGHPSDSYTPDVVIEGFRFPRRGINAIALYSGDANTLIGNSDVTTCNLLDAVVYGRSLYLNNILRQTLIPGQEPLTLPSNTDVEVLSLGRCRGWKPSILSSYRTMPLSPGIENTCQIPQIYINEINIYETAESGQFIEIYDGGVGHVSLDGVVILAYSKYLFFGSAFDLTGATTDIDGFFVVSSAGSNVNLSPPLGVALLLGPPNYEVASKINEKIDAIVCGNEGEVNLDFLEKLTPGQDQVNIPAQPESISRCDTSQRLSNAMFGHGPRTEWELNTNCTRNNLTVTETLPVYQNLIRINEINVNQPGHDAAEFIELSGNINTSLDGLKVVLFNGRNREKAYRVFDLTGYQMDSYGFFLIGAPVNGSQPQIEVTDRAWLQNGPDAVALYQNSDIVVGDQANTVNIIDAIVYGTRQRVDRRLIRLLVPGQKQIMEDTNHVEGDEAILRCFSRKALEQYAFGLGYPSPGKPNICPLPPVIINEINIHTEGRTGVYIELKTPGKPNFPLDNLTLVEYVADSDLNKFSVIDNVRTNRDGLLLLADFGSLLPMDALLFTGLSDLGDTEGAIALFRGEFREVYSRDTATSEGLVDAIIFKKQHGGSIWQGPPNIPLTKFGHVVVETFDESVVDESVNRCEYENETVYVTRTLSPKMLNHCPPHNVVLVINELNMFPAEQYIEIWDLGFGSTSLDGFLIVLFSESGHSYFTIDLNGYTTDQDGYLVVGVRITEPYPALTLAPGFMRTSTGAVAIYKAAFEMFSDQGLTTPVGLMDCVVYSDFSRPVYSWTANLYANQQPPLLSSMFQSSGQSLSRCLSLDHNTPTPFLVSDPTPEALNACPVQTYDILINELKVRLTYSGSEFIELRTANGEFMELNGISVVLYSGIDQDRSYRTIDLTGYNTDDDGYFLIGNDERRADYFIKSGFYGFLQTGPGAVAIYRAPSGAFLHGTTVTTTSLIDAVVYTNDSGDRTLLNTLAPNQIIVNENSMHNKGEESISRCLSQLPVTFSAFVNSQPTPGTFNNCTLTKILINEVNADQPGNDNADFIELYDGGRGNASLDALVVVIFDGSTSRSMKTIPLQNYRTDSNGYFLIGHGLENLDIDVNNGGFLSNGPGAVALYRGDHRNLSFELFPTRTHLEDVLVYSTNEEVNLGLVTNLLPGQSEVLENATFIEGDESIGRCYNQDLQSSKAFGLGKPTPKQPNVCIDSNTGQGSKPRKSEIVINEINPRSSSDNGPQFIELKGDPGHYLESFIIVLYEILELGARIYSRFSLGKNTIGKDGFFLIGEQGMNPTADLEIGNGAEELIHSATSAVALYLGTEEAFPIGGILTTENLQDAVIYTTFNTSTASNYVIQQLASNQGVFYENNKILSYQVSISRCFCCQTRSTNAFMMSAISPKEDNTCPLKKFLKTIQMRLINADYSKWKGDSFLLSALVDVVVSGIESKCKCGFSPAYFTRNKVLNGSVVFQTDMSAITKTQADQLFASYKYFIQNTTSVIVASQNFTVDTSCIVGCVPDDEFIVPSKQSSDTGLSAGLVIGAAIAVVTFVGIVIVIVFIIRKKHLCKCRKSLDIDVFKVTKTQELNDLDVLGTVYDVTAPSSVSGSVPFQP